MFGASCVDSCLSDERTEFLLAIRSLLFIRTHPPSPHAVHTTLCICICIHRPRFRPPRSLFWRDISRVQHRLEHTCPVRRAVGAKSELEVKHPENRAHLPVRKVILCILPKEFEFFPASLGTTGDEGGRGGTRGTTDTTGTTGTTAMKEVCWVEVGCV